MKSAFDLPAHAASSRVSPRWSRLEAALSHTCHADYRAADRRAPTLGKSTMPEFNRLAPFTARHILMLAGALERDYRELSTDQVTRLIIYADQYRYPKPSNAAGPRGRYWHEYLLRRAAKAETRR